MKALCYYEHTFNKQQKGTSKVIAKPGGAAKQLSQCSPKVELEAPTVSKLITTAPANPFSSIL